MADEPLDPILIQVTVPLPTAMIFAGLTDPAHLAGWLCSEARVEAQVGGEYRLSFQEPATFVSEGRITKLTPEVEVGFTWGAPAEFAKLLNEPELRTSAYVRLQESPEGIDVTLEHDGWLSGEAWEDARSWHFHFWDERLHRLKDYLLKAAYG